MVTPLLLPSPLVEPMPSSIDDFVANLNEIFNINLKVYNKYSL